MGPLSNVAQAVDAEQQQDRERPDAAEQSPAPRTAPASHTQLPCALLDSHEVSDFAVVLWSHYEDLMAPGIDGGRAPARARRCTVGASFGASLTVVDDARRELLREDTAGGPWLRRSALQGRKRATRHLALRRPQDTGVPFVRVPEWTRERVWRGRGRAEGRYTAGAWRLYAKALQRTGSEGGQFTATMAGLGAMVRVSAPTARRRLAELEAAGLAQVTERPGGWPQIRIVVHPDDAAAVAVHYAEHGRQTAAPPRDPSQIPASTPSKFRHPPLSGSGTPQETDLQETHLEETSGLPPLGENLQEDAREREAAAGKQDHRFSCGTAPAPAPRQPARGASPEAVRLLRNAMPRRLLQEVPEHGVRRVLRALDAELAHRSAAELADRIGVRWEAWRYRIEDVTDPTAIAITIVRRGYDCADIRCEAQTNLDTATPCGWCVQQDHGRNTEETGRGPQNHPVITPDRDHEPLSATQATEPRTPKVSSPTSAPPSRSGALKAPKCSRCDIHRLIETPDGAMMRCPTCHPLAPDANDATRCDRCSRKRWTEGGRCPICDADAPMDDRERSQLAAVLTRFGVVPSDEADRAQLAEALGREGLADVADRLPLVADEDNQNTRN